MIAVETLARIALRRCECPRKYLECSNMSLSHGFVEYNDLYTIRLVNTYFVQQQIFFYKIKINDQIHYFVFQQFCECMDTMS